MDTIGRELIIIGSQVQRRNLAFCDGIRQAGNNIPLDLVLDIADCICGGCTKAFLQESFRIGNTESIVTESTQADHTRIGGAPLAVQELPGIDEIDVRFERAVKTILPGLQCSQNRHVGCLEFITAGLENISELAFIHENGDLTLPDGELSSHHDLLTVHVVLMNNRVLAGISPFNNINQLALDHVKDSHCLFLLSIMHD